MARARDKCLGAAEAAERIAAWSAGGERVTLLRGTFDLLGVEHVRALERARGRGGRLVACVLDDRASAAMLGPGRPVLPAEERALLVAGLRGVDLVLVLGEGGPGGSLAALPVEAAETGGPATERRRSDVVDRLRARLGLSS